MGLRSFVKNTVKVNTNVKGWASWDTIKANAQIVGSMVDDLKAPKQDETPSTTTFEETIKRLGLSEKDLLTQMQSHVKIAIFCALLGLGALGWMFFLLIKGMFFSALMAFSLSALMFAYAFQEHMAYFRIKQRRLDCTVSEWFSHLLSSKK